MPVDLDRLRKTLREADPASQLESEIKTHKEEIADALKKGEVYIIHVKKGGEYRIVPQKNAQERRLCKAGFLEFINKCLR